MIRKSILLAALVIPLVSVQAQDKKSKSPKTTISIVKEVDGKTTRIDTTFTDADHVTIEAFFKKNGVNTPPPPPPPPPAPPIPGVPPPPLPEEESSFNFHFCMPEFETSFEFDLEKEMKNLKESLQDLKIDIKTNLNEEELENIQKDLEKEMEHLKDEIKKQNRAKRENIRKKTGTNHTSAEDNLGYIYKISTPENGTSTVIAGISDEPIIVAGTRLDKNYAYTYCNTRKEVKKQSKIRTLMNKVIERILD